MLTEPRICRLGNSLFLFIVPSDTPTSDHANGAVTPVLLLVRTRPILASFNWELLKTCVYARENTVNYPVSGLQNPAMFSNPILPLPGNVTNCSLCERNNLAANWLVCEAL